MLFNDSFVNIVTITFSALIMIELLNVYTEIQKFNWKMFLLLCSSVIVYFFSIIVFKNYIDTGYIDYMFLLKVLGIVGIAWLPLHLLKFIIEKCDPSEHRKILERKDQ